MTSRLVVVALLSAREVHSQSELAALLADEGIDVTQATLSRDLEELGAVKLRGADGGTGIYVVPEDGSPVRGVFGGTDRLALGGAARSRYEANTGLAQARAAALKRDLEQRCLSPLATSPGRVLLLASGPATTPDRAFCTRSTNEPGALGYRMREGVGLSSAIARASSQ